MKDMAIKRNETKENIFVTNEYFEMFGVSRQVVEYQRISTKIKSFGMLKGMNLYFKLDADILILRYWMNNLRRFVKEWEKTSQLRKEARKRLGEINAMNKVHAGNGYGLSPYEREVEDLRATINERVSSREYFELKKLIKHYWLSESEMECLDNKLCNQRMKLTSEITSFLYRLGAYRESKLSLGDYKKKEKAQIAKGKKYHDILDYFLMRNGKRLSPEEMSEISTEIMANL